MNPRPFALLPLLLAGCSQTAPTAATAPAAAPAAVAVKMAKPKRQSLNWFVDQPGTVLAFEATPLVAKLPGYVGALHADLGDAVEAGQVLADIRIPELVEESRQKEAAVRECAAGVDQAKQALTLSKEQVKTAEAMDQKAEAGVAKTRAELERWRSEVKRLEGLVASRVVDAQTLDETRKQFHSAEATEDEAESHRDSARSLIREAQAKVGSAAADVAAAEAKKAVAEADAARSKALLEYTQIRAPFRGVVTGRFVHTGHFLQPSAGRAEPLFTVARLDTVRVFAELPESAAARVAAKGAATVRLPSLGDREIPATITRLSGVLNPDSRTLRIEVDLPNADGAIRPGTYAVVRVPVAVPDALTLPAPAVQFADETAYAFLVENGKAVRYRVRVGRADGGVVQVLGRRRAAVTVGDFVPFTGDETAAVSNLGALSDGAAVAEEK